MKRIRKYSIIFRYALVVPVLALLYPSTALAQMDDIPLNLPKYDKQPIHFGFTIGINSSNFTMNLAPDLKTMDSVYRVESLPITGLNLGIISNLRIGNNLDLRFIPALSFAQRNLQYSMVLPDSSKGTITKKIESTYLEFPFDLKFKSNRVNNYRAYVLAGFKYAIDMVSQAKVREQDKDIIKLKRRDYGYEVGIGFDFYMPYFKFSPEIKMYNGIPNILVQDRATYSNPIERLRSKIFLVSFTFE
ncbi:MAG: PorT family protein [Bacteroidia bacterium]|nr:PorT family protein [Bacteroidia bacterium]